MILLTQHALDLRKFTPSELTVNLWPLSGFFGLPFTSDDLGGMPTRMGRAPALKSGALHAALQAVQIIACSSEAAAMSEQLGNDAELPTALRK
jgi:hypothetical protein